MIRGLTRVAVVQPLPGIGDMVWHLPHIRALAVDAGTAVTLVAKPRSAADELFAGDPAVADVLWMDRNPDGRHGAHDGAAGLWRLAAALRARRFQAVVLLHHSRSLAFAALLAGIPRRHGYGFGAQRPLLNRPPFLPGPVLSRHPFDQARAYLAAAGIAMSETEPRLHVASAACGAARARLGVPPGPLLAIGIGSSEPYKQWGAARFAELARRLRADGWRNIVLVGGAAEAQLAEDIRVAAGVPLPMAIGWRLRDVAALFAASDGYVGNDTGVMNMAAACGIPAVALFGAVPPIAHSRHIVPVLPPDGRPDIATGMTRIAPDAVLAAVRAAVRGPAPAGG